VLDINSIDQGEMNREMTQHNELAKVLQAELDMDPIAYFSKKTESEF
jgi:hypothetical protein